MTIDLLPGRGVAPYAPLPEPRPGLTEAAVRTLPAPYGDHGRGRTGRGPGPAPWQDVSSLPDAPEEGDPYVLAPGHGDGFGFPGPAGPQARFLREAPWPRPSSAPPTLTFHPPESP